MTSNAPHLHETGSARAVILVGLAGMLVAAAALLWLVLGAGAPSEEEGDEQVVEPPPRPPPASGPQLAVRHSEPPPKAGGSMLKSSQRVQKLMGHLRKGAKSEDELAAKGPASRIKVTVKGPPSPPAGMNPDIWVHMNEVLPGFTRCYQQRLLEKPGVRGKLVLSLSMVAGDGHATAKGDIHKDSTIKDFKLQQCILKRLAGAMFPLPLAEAKLKVTYPVVLQPGASAPGTGVSVAPRTPAGEPPRGAPPHPLAKEELKGTPPPPPPAKQPPAPRASDRAQPGPKGEPHVPSKGEPPHPEGQPKDPEGSPDEAPEQMPPRP